MTNILPIELKLKDEFIGKFINPDYLCVLIKDFLKVVDCEDFKEECKIQVIYNDILSTDNKISNIRLTEILNID